MSPLTNADQIVNPARDARKPIRTNFRLQNCKVVSRALAISGIVLAMSAYGKTSQGRVASNAELMDGSPEVRSTRSQIGQVVPLKAQHFSIGTGLAASGGLSSSAALLNLQGSYSIELSPSIIGKALANLSFGSGSDSSHFNDFALGTEYLVGRIGASSAQPYFGADIGYGIARDIHSVVADGIVYSVSTGLKAQLNATAFEIGFRYQLMANRLHDSRPRTIGIVAAIDL